MENIKKKKKQELLNHTLSKSVKDNFDNSDKENDPFTINDSPKNKNLELSSKSNCNEVKSFRLLNNFLNEMDDQSKDKIFLISFLSIPRIMNMIISNEQKYKFIFYCSPTNVSCLYGIETFIFKWNECNNYNLVGYFDLINVENCYLNENNRKIIEIILNDKSKNKNNECSNHYSIETDEENIAVTYVNAITFTSQLVKYRIYLRNKK